MNECVRDNDFGWCTTHDVPFVQDVCLSKYGVTAETAGPMAQMYQNAVDIRQRVDEIQFEMDSHECDHENCHVDCIEAWQLEDESYNHYKRWLQEVVRSGTVSEEAKNHLLFYP